MDNLDALRNEARCYLEDIGSNMETVRAANTPKSQSVRVALIRYLRMRFSRRFITAEDIANVTGLPIHTVEKELVGYR